MKKYVIAFVFILFIGIIALVWKGMTSFDQRVDLVNAFTQDALPTISNTWSYDETSVYFAPNISQDPRWSRRLKAYSKLGKLDKCPKVPENEIELSFIDESKAHISLICSFENAQATIIADLHLGENAIVFRSFEIMSDVFFD